LRKINLAFIGGLIILSHAAFAADNSPTRSVEIAIPQEPIVAPTMSVPTSLPTANIESGCRDGVEVADPTMRSSAYEACVRDERSAFEQLRKQWANYSAEARRTCIWPENGVPVSYVELQICLEMQPGGSLAVGAASDGLNSYDYDITGSPPPTMASPSPTMAPPTP
jgi:hypothetical protein